MKIFFIVILAILVFLAISSGVTKIALMQQDVEFFGKYGFTDLILIAFGVTQLIGGILLIMQKTRFVGAMLVQITFLISAILLIMDGNILFTIFTFIAMFMLGLIMYQSIKKENIYRPEAPGL